VTKLFAQLLNKFYLKFKEKRNIELAIIQIPEEAEQRKFENFEDLESLFISGFLFYHILMLKID
jgi:hypothetical protein